MIPPGWTEVALGDVCMVTMGQAPPGESYNTTGAGLPLVAGAGDFGTLHPVAKKFTSAASKRSAPGDIILGIRATIGVKVIADGEYCLGRGVAGLRAAAHLHDRYLWHWLTDAQDFLASKGRGATFLQVNRKDITELPMSLPPIEEQRRIAAVLDQADELRAKRRAALDLLGTLTESIFLDMFGDPAAPASKWASGQLGDVADFLDHQRRPITAADREPGPVPYYGANGVQDHVSGHLFDEPLVLLAEDGGHFAQPWKGIAYRIEGPSWVNNHAHVLRPQPGVESYYLCEALRRRDVTRFLTGTTRGKLTKSSAMRIPILLPPSDLQRAFGLRARTVETEARRGIKSSVRLDALFASLQQRAFRGEL